jgi:hypothetical protein
MGVPDNRSEGRENGDWALAWLALVLAWAILGYPWLSGHYTIPWDAKAQFLPQVQFLASSLAEGESPFWAPFVFSGHPQVADPQSLIFSPPYLLLATLDATPTARAADATLLAMILCAAAAMMLWLADKGWHPAAALVTALSFAFGAAMAWRIQHVGQVLSLCYLPIVLLLLDRALDRRSILYGMGAGLAAAFLVLGRDQVALLAIYFLVGYVAYRMLSAADRMATLKAAMPPLAGAALIGIAVITVPVLLTLLVAQNSNRPAIDLEGAVRGSLHPALFLTAFAPDVFGSSGRAGHYWGPPSAIWNDTGLYLAQNMGQLYMGALPLAALILATVTGIIGHRDIRYIFIAFVVAIVYALGWYTPIFAVMHAILPGVDLYRRPADAVFLIGFLASVLSGYALHRLLTDQTLSLTRLQTGLAILIPVAAFSGLLALAVHFGELESSWLTTASSAAIFLVSAAILHFAIFGRGNAGIILPAFAVLLTGDLAWSNGPGGATALPPQNYEVLDPASTNETITLLEKLTTKSQSATRRDRIELVGFGFHWPNASLTHGLENTLGYNPVRLQLYTRASGAEDHVGLPEQRKFSHLFPSYRSTLANLLGLRYIATSVPVETIDKNLRPGDLTLIARTADGFVYENPRAMPRVLFANAALRADFEKILDSGTWPDTDLNSTVLLESDVSAPLKAAGSARIVAYHHTAVTIETESLDGGWVVLNDVWQPWWFATIDGTEAPVLRANALFRAVAVPAGRHTVTFTFQPIRGAMRELYERR